MRYRGQIVQLVALASWGEHRTYIQLPGGRVVGTLPSEIYDDEGLKMGTLAVELWDQLDSVVWKLREESQPLDEVQLATLRGEAKGLAYALVIATTPFFRTVTEVAEEAQRRYDAKKNGDKDYVTMGFKGSAWEARLQGDAWPETGYPTTDPYGKPWPEGRGRDRLSSYKDRVKNFRQMWPEGVDPDAIGNRPSSDDVDRGKRAKRPARPRSTETSTAAVQLPQLSDADMKGLREAKNAGFPMAIVAKSYGITAAQAEALLAG